MRLALFLVALLATPFLAGCAEEPSATTTPTSTSPAATSPAISTPASSTPPVAEGGKCVSQASDKSAATPTWVVETSMGTMRVALFCDKTPITAQNIVTLTERGYFDGTKFHRVIENFMDQGGDPLTKDDSKSAQWGTGGPGYTIKDEFYCKDGTVSYTLPATCPTGLGLKHDTPGTLSMANTGRAQTGGSQFFLTAVATPHLDGKHAVFGHTADQASLDVALAINQAPTGAGDRPNPPIVLERATIEWG